MRCFTKFCLFHENALAIIQQEGLLLQTDFKNQLSALALGWVGLARRGNLFKKKKKI